MRGAEEMHYFQISESSSADGWMTGNLEGAWRSIRGQKRESL